MTTEKKELPVFKDAEILLGKSGQPIALSIPTDFSPDNKYHLKISQGKIDILKNGEPMATVLLSDTTPKEIYEGLSKNNQISIISCKNGAECTGNISAIATMDVDEDSIKNAPSVELPSKKDAIANMPMSYDAFTNFLKNQEKMDKDLLEKVMADYRKQQEKVQIPEAANTNILQALKDQQSKFSGNNNQKSTPHINAMHAGDNIKGHVDSVAPIGSSQNIERADSIAKGVGGFLIPLATTMAIKMMISAAITTAIPAAAPIAIPVIFAVYSAYQLGKKAKTKNGSPIKNILSAAKENKFHAGMLLGALAAGILLRTGGFDPAADLLTEKIQIATDELGSSTSDMNFPEITMPNISFPEIDLPEFFTDDTPDVTDTTETAKVITEENIYPEEAIDNVKPELHAEYADLSGSELKQKAFELFNGRGGEAVNQAMAVNLYEQAAEMGNVDAKVDLAYIQYHGLAGVSQNVEASLQTMKDLGRSEWLGGQHIPELSPQESRFSVSNHSMSSEISSEHISALQQADVTNANNYTVLPEGEAADRLFDQELISAIQSGQTTATDGIVTIEPQSNLVFYTHAVDGSENEFTTHVLTMEQYKGADFLNEAAIGIFDGPNAYSHELLTKEMSGILNFAENQGGDAQTGVVIGFASNNPDVNATGGSVDIHAYQDANGKIHMNFITDDYLSENKDTIKAAAGQTVEIERMGNKIVFSNDFKDASERMINNSGIKISTPASPMPDISAVQNTESNFAKAKINIEINDKPTHNKFSTGKVTLT